MNRGTVYYRDIPAGTLERSAAGYVFRYDDAYRANPSLPDISATLPKTRPEYRSKFLFPSGHAAFRLHPANRRS